MRLEPPPLSDKFLRHLESLAGADAGTLRITTSDFDWGVYIVWRVCGEKKGVRIGRDEMMDNQSARETIDLIQRRVLGIPIEIDTPKLDDSIEFDAADLEVWANGTFADFMEPVL